MICNDCAPKPNYDEGRAFAVSLYKGMTFKTARSDVVFMKSEDLKSLNEHVMGTLRASNVVVTDSSNYLLPIM